MPDQSSRIILLTGGTSGIGRAAAEELVKKNGHVVVTGRRAEKGMKAVQEIREAAKGCHGVIEYMKCDHSSLKENKHFADEFRQKLEGIKDRKFQVLINNAGVALPRHKITEDGFEITLAANYFGPVLLTGLLKDILLETSPGSRVVYESSCLEQWGHIDWDDIGGSKAKTSDMGMYGTSKLYLLMIVKELQRRYGSKGTDYFASHPGWSNTSLYSNMQKSAAFFWFFRVSEILFGQSSKRGCISMLYCATAPELEGKGGQFIGPFYWKLWVSNLFNTHPCKPMNPIAIDVNAQKRLYEETERLLEERAPNNVPRPII